jgi:hypothetical protein
VNEKPLVIIAAGMIIVATISVAAYLTLSTDDENEEGGNNEVSSILEDAGSLEFSFNYTDTDGLVSTHMFKAKNIGSPEMLLLAETTRSYGEPCYFVLLMNGAEQKCWERHDDQEWVDDTDIFPDVLDTWTMIFQDLTSKLSGWDGGENYIYTDENASVLNFYSIRINPTLDDSLFEPLGIQT